MALAFCGCIFVCVATEGVLYRLGADAPGGGKGPGAMRLAEQVCNRQLVYKKHQQHLLWQASSDGVRGRLTPALKGPAVSVRIEIS